MHKSLTYRLLGCFLGLALTLSVPQYLTFPEEVVPAVAAPQSPAPDSTIIRYARRYRTTPAIAQVIVTKANKYRVPHSIAFRLVRTESQFNPRAVSPVGALGLTQVMPATARMLDPKATPEKLFDPAYNAELGFRFLRQMHDRYDGDWWRALVAYNQGPVYADTTNRTTHKYADVVLHLTAR